ncbi:UNVERIFIED_CONTAM: putative mitochondrial protein [Sesamum radiatum]|uniref:Mitochondrial protein n=1 Tax=Sesamum radiatum TaxID=300843 RepID=A0AAW2V924_SESRA
MAEDLQRPYTETEPQSLTQCRPISLCNVAYKIASKTIANRLKPWLDRIIFPSQSAFVPGRLIADNVLLAFETNHFLHTHSKGLKHFMNLKLDISKAYDRVEWSFLRTVLGKLSFSCNFVELVMLCVSSVSYSFILSGKQFGSISLERGLRQGDPLSPYLFLLCTESLSALFRAAADKGTIPGVAVCRGAPHISHLLFADDTMVFCPANTDTVLHVKHLLDTYRLASGQEINLAKSSVAFSRNTPLAAQHQLADALGIRLENKHEVYLGLPAVAFRSKKVLFAALKDRIWRRIQGWHEKTLSQAAKQLWRLLSRPESLVSKVLKAKYYPRTHLFEAQIGTRPSYTWRSLFAALNLLKAGCRWRIRTGHSVNIWTDPWVPRIPSLRIITPKSSDVHISYVSELIVAGTGEWDVELINALFWPEDQALILQIPLSRVGMADLLVWHYSPNGLFSVRSAYHLALSLISSVGSSNDRWCQNSWRAVWQAHVPNKVKLFLWRAIRDILPTASKLRRRLSHEVVSCPFCDFSDESPIHTLLRCSFARQVWAISGLRWYDIDSLAWTVEEWFQALALKLSATDFSLMAMFCWTIW